MLRRTLLAILLASLLLCTLATIASFFHVAYYNADYTPRPDGSPPPGANLTLILRGGCLQGWDGGSYYDPGWSLNPGGTRYLTWWPPESKFFGSWQRSDTSTSYRFHIPLWIPLATLVALTLPPAWLEARVYRHNRRSTKGLCSRCGYNLAGLTPHACPECGSTTSAQATPRPNPR
jgi:hypothetical protein